MRKICRYLAVSILAFAFIGCAAYRTSSNIESDSVHPKNADKKILISQDSLSNRKYKIIRPVEVSVKKSNLFLKNPTKEQANAALIEKARAIGADAVINVVYDTGIGFTTWGYIDAKGDGVTFLE